VKRPEAMMCSILHTTRLSLVAWARRLSVTKSKVELTSWNRQLKAC